MTNSEYNKLQGIWPALFTPVDKNGCFNSHELEKLIELMIRQGVDGFYLLGSTGQGFLFSEKERLKIAEDALSIVNGRLPVMVQVGAMNTLESVRLAQHAAKVGAVAISSVGPIYYSGGIQMALEHYRKIAVATDRPFFPYQIGNVDANDHFIAGLKKIPNIGGMKLTTGNLLSISSIHRKGHPDWRLFSGADELLCHAALCGTAGAIGTSYNLIGDTCKAIRQDFLDGNVKAATGFMMALQAFIERILPVIRPFFQRELIIRHGIDIGNPLPPLMTDALPFTDDEIMEMITSLEEFKNKN